MSLNVSRIFYKRLVQQRCSFFKSLCRQAALTESNTVNVDVLAISNMVQRLGVRDAEGNLGSLRALLHMCTNPSQAFMWWKAWIHTEYTPCTELRKLVGFSFSLTFPSEAERIFWCSVCLPKNFFNRQTYKHDKYLIQEPLCFKAQNIQRAPCLALKQLLRSWNKKGLPKSLQISCHQFF